MLAVRLNDDTMVLAMPGRAELHLYLHNCATFTSVSSQLEIQFRTHFLLNTDRNTPRQRHMVGGTGGTAF